MFHKHGKQIEKCHFCCITFVLMYSTRVYSYDTYMCTYNYVCTHVCGYVGTVCTMYVDTYVYTYICMKVFYRVSLDEY